MAFKVIKGDIFDPKLDKIVRVIVHGCNAQGVMGSGIAKIIRDKYPEVYEDYKAHEAEHGLNLGDVLYTIINDNLVVCSAITQKFYGRDPNITYVDYLAVANSLNEIAKHAKGLDLEIHLPYIGGGLANGSRKKLLNIFEESLKGCEATLFIQD
jgi:O-acetyl-ADP-ribose deacetylase (regulator of RNase III)